MAAASVDVQVKLEGADALHRRARLAGVLIRWCLAPLRVTVTIGAR